MDIINQIVAINEPGTLSTLECIRRGYELRGKEEEDIGLLNIANLQRKTGSRELLVRIEIIGN